MKNLKRWNNLSLVLMIITWGLFCFGNISLDTVLIVSMIWQCRTDNRCSIIGKKII